MVQRFWLVTLAPFSYRTRHGRFQYQNGQWLVQIWDRSFWGRALHFFSFRQIDKLIDKSPAYCETNNTSMIDKGNTNSYLRSFNEMIIFRCGQSEFQSKAQNLIKRSGIGSNECVQIVGLRDFQIIRSILIRRTFDGKCLNETSFYWTRLSMDGAPYKSTDTYWARAHAT